MLTRVFLAAGVAALAIAAPAMAGPGGDHHDGGGQHGGGGGGGGPPHGGGGGGGHGGGGGGHAGGSPFMGGGGGGRGHGGGGQASSGQRGGGGARFAAPQMRGGFARQEARGGYGRMSGRQQTRGYSRMSGRQQARGYSQQQMRGSHGHQQIRMAGRQHTRGFAAHQQGRSFAQRQSGGFSRHQTRMSHGQTGLSAQRQQAFANAGPGARGRTAGAAQFANGQFRGNSAQIASGQFAGRQFAGRSAGNAPSYSALSYGNNVQVRPFNEVNRFIGAPVGQVAAIAGLAPLPVTMQYLYPDTPGYYYRYGDGYLYQVDRTTDLIAALIPLLAGGYLPGQYLPSAYMADYVPDYYGFDAFYPDDGGLCNRYYRGVVYQVDCDDGYVENVIPMYAGGYGVGELLPSAYGYYNVPLQYRGLYYDTPEAGYWYSPGAIYQYDPHTSVITSVAALMGPGLAIGQALPAGYSAYNVPYAYRSAYNDGPSAWYRYSNGYIYQVNPATQLVTAIVASLLT